MMTGATVAEPARLDRTMGLMQATATNIVGMIGVGPFLTVPTMVAAMGGPHILYAWGVGAILALADGLVYAQLGAALPGSGGAYVYLREAYRPFGFGRLLAFVFLFQIMVVAPLTIASGAVGFASYLGFYWRGMTPLSHHLIAGAVCIVMTGLLYRHIREIGRVAVWMLVGVTLTVGWVIVAGLFKFSGAQAFPPHALRLDADFGGRLSAATLLAVYNYGGYNNICNIGEEIRAPERTIPRAVVLSILCVVVLYVAMSTVILGVVPWAEVAQSETIASLFIGRTFADPAAGRLASVVMTALILFVTASSLYSVILGYSRIPFAAARDGQFFEIFARVHPTKHFPYVSLLTIGAISLPFCFLSLGTIVNWLILVQILLQFIWQCAGVVLLHRYRSDLAQPFRMWLYPLPAIVSFAMWIAIFATGPRDGIVFTLALGVCAVVAYWLFSRSRVFDVHSNRPFS